jgi:hypothetical protein
MFAVTLQSNPRNFQGGAHLLEYLKLGGLTHRKRAIALLKMKQGKVLQLARKEVATALRLEAIEARRQEGKKARRQEKTQKAYT